MGALSLFGVCQLPQGGRATPYMMVHVGLMVLMIAIWHTGKALANSDQRRVIWLGLALHVALAFVPPFTSDDSERYVWDGAVAVAGYDPYALAPNAPELAALHKAWRTPAGTDTYPMLYPPLALALFSTAALAGPRHASMYWQAFVTCAALALIMMVLATLWRTDALRNAPLVALNPLLLLEAEVGAHLDVFAALFVAVAVWAVVAGRGYLIGVGLAAGVLVKLSPAVALLAVAFNFHARPRNSFTKILGSALVVIVAGYGLALGIGLHPVGWLGAFVLGVRFGSPLWVEPYTGIAAAVALGGTLAWRHRTDALRTMTIALTTLLACTPVIFPWYLLVLVPLWAMRPSAFGMLWMLTLPLTYEVLDAFERDGTWTPATWPLAVIAGGWILAMLIGRMDAIPDWWYARRQRIR